jgi:hypothetical protein
MICPLLPAVPGNERAIWSWKLGYERSLENRSYFVRCVGTRRLWPETPGLTKRSPAQGAPESCTTHFSSRTSCLEQAASGNGYTACCCAVWCDLGRRSDEQTGGKHYNQWQGQNIRLKLHALLRVTRSAESKHCELIHQVRVAKKGE